MKQKNKGITLIALVITIIILLILAGITITSLTNSELFQKAQLAKEKAENSQNKENEILNDYESSINKILNGNRETNGTYTELSLEEKVIGKWIDGKTLYSKTMDIDLTAENMQTYNHNIQNVDIIWIDLGNTFFANNNKGTIYPFFSVGITGATFPEFENSAMMYIQSVDKNNITIRAGASATINKAYITLKYTKTE